MASRKRVKQTSRMWRWAVLAALVAVVVGGAAAEDSVTVCTCSRGRNILDRFEDKLEELHESNRILQEKLDALTKYLMKGERPDRSSPEETRESRGEDSGQNGSDGWPRESREEGGRRPGWQGSRASKSARGTREASISLQSEEDRNGVDMGENGIRRHRRGSREYTDENYSDYSDYSESRKRSKEKDSREDSSRRESRESKSRESKSRESKSRSREKGEEEGGRTVPPVDKDDFGTNLPTYPRNCIDVRTMHHGETNVKTGLYLILNPVLSPRPIRMWCEMRIQGGGWMTVLRRKDGTENFNRTWADYKKGFGAANDEYWMGLEPMHWMTAKEPHELLVILRTYDGHTYFAKFTRFIVANERNNYALQSLGQYQGNAGDSLRYHMGMGFTTKDRRNDHSSSDVGNCAIQFHGGWWFRACFESHLTGDYIKANHETRGRGVIWNTVKKNTPLQYAEMLIRPKK